MRYVMRHKIFGIGGDSTIKNDRGQDVLFVDGAALSIGRRLVIKDMKGHELVTIQQRLIALTPSFEIYRKDGPSATISKKLISPFVDRLKVDLPGWDDIEVVGDLFDHEYNFRRGGREIAHVSKKWLTLVDSYGVDIAPGQDDVLLLASAVVIDELLDMEDRRDD